MSAPVARSPAVSLAAGEPAVEGYRRVLANLAASVDANLPGTVEDLDPEFLHELRVAVRRTRTILADAEGVLPETERARARELFRWLGAITTGPRDLDVQVLDWEATVAPLEPADARALEPVRLELEARRHRAHHELAVDLQGEAAGADLDAWRTWLAAPVGRSGTGPDPAWRPLGPLVARRIERAQRRLLRAGRAVEPSSPVEHLHEVRKDAKRLRYLLECFATLLDDRARQRFVGSLKRLQDDLGAHQDATVRAAQLRSLAEDLHADGAGVDVLLALGALVGETDRAARRHRRRFARRFAAYDSKHTRRQLATMLRPARGA